MTGPEHFLAGEHALEESEMFDVRGRHCDIPMSDAYAARAAAHFAAAQALCYGALVADAEQDNVSQEWATLLGIRADGE